MTLQPTSAGQSLQSLKTVVGMMVAGTASFAAIVGYIAGNGRTLAARMDDVLLLIAAGLMIAAPVAAAFVRQAMIRTLAQHSQREIRSPDPGPETFLPQYFTATIITAASFEAAAFFALVVVLVNGNTLGFAVAAVGLVGMLVVFPTSERLRRFGQACRGMR